MYYILFKILFSLFLFFFDIRTLIYPSSTGVCDPISVVQPVISWIGGDDVRGFQLCC